LTSKEITKELLDQAIATALQADADLIVITGDFVQFDPEPSEYLAKNWLSRLKVFNYI
jgi:hypothetical protein